MVLLNKNASESVLPHRDIYAEVVELERWMLFGQAVEVRKETASL